MIGETPQPRRSHLRVVCACRAPIVVEAIMRALDDLAESIVLPAEAEDLPVLVTSAAPDVVIAEEGIGDETLKALGSGRGLIVVSTEGCRLSVRGALGSERDAFEATPKALRMLVVREAIRGRGAS